MGSEFDQAKSALKSLADARRSGKPIDISSLPEPLRSKLQAQLARLSPEMQKEFLAKGSPIIDRAIERVEQKAGVASARLPDRTWQNTGVLPGNYSGHYNNTVQPGDRLHLTIGRVLMFLGLVAMLYYYWLRVSGGL